MEYRRVLTIAGSDSGGGAGIQADIKTISAMGCYAATAITAVTVQNTLGVAAVHPVPADIIRGQICAVHDDIGADAIKIGMLGSAEAVLAVGEALRSHEMRSVVLDPVMVSTSGHRLTEDGAVGTMCRELFPLATVITPNIPEGEVLAETAIRSEADMEQAAEKIFGRYGCAVLLKGGHSLNDANDLLYRDGGFKWFKGRRIDNPNTHGTGCTLSSAIASNLAKGFDMDTAVERSKEYISGALEAMLDLGRGSGPMKHAFNVTGYFAEER